MEDGNNKQELLSEHGAEAAEVDVHVVVEEEIPLPKKEFVLPTQPPYTAFAGNLAPTVEDQRQVVDAIVAVDEKIAVDRVRLMTDRETGKRKGYCYIELKSVEDLSALLNLNGELMVAGRILRLDVATSQRSNSGGDRRRGGGRFGHRDRDNRRGGGHPSSEADGSKFRGGFQRRDEQRERPSERPKLVIRSVRGEGGSPGGNGASERSNIFGGGKPRDEQKGPASSLQRSLKTSEEHDNQHSNGGRFGGRGDRKGGRSGRGGRGHHHSGRYKGGRDDDYHRGAQHKPEPKPLPVAQENKSSVTKTVNKFAALGFDSDSD